MVFRTANTLNVTYAAGNQGYYGSFYSLIDQTDGVNTATLLYAENTSDANGITMELGDSGKLSQMTFAHAGTYNIQFSGQLHNNGGGGAGNTVNIWFRLNGNNIPSSNTKVTVPSNAPYVVASWNFIVSVAAGDYVELVFSSDNANVGFDHVAADATNPAVPSLIFTAVQVR